MATPQLSSSVLLGAATRQVTCRLVVPLQPTPPAGKLGKQPSAFSSLHSPEYYVVTSRKRDRKRETGYFVETLTILFILKEKNIMSLNFRS
jgi:hypothetical protein